MKKVVLSLALVAVLGLSFTSCKKTEEETPAADTTVVEAPAPVEADTTVVDTTVVDTTAAPAPAAE
jgi:predicted secreted protein